MESYAEDLLRKSLDSALTMLVGPDWEEDEPNSTDEEDLQTNRFMSTGLQVGRRR